jgi:hypothetical protein
MIVSSRTPEGAPNHCPVCNQDVCLEPSVPPGDAPCPHCGSLLWFVPSFAAPPAGRRWLKNLPRDSRGRPVDAHGNVLDPVTGHVDFAATFASVLPHAGEERTVRSLSFWERVLAFFLRREPPRGVQA